MGKLNVKKIEVGNNILGGIKEIFNAHKEYKIVASQEKTKRTKIQADKEEFIQKIHAQRDVMIHALDGSFKERGKNFKALFDNLDKALMNDKDDIASQILGGIIDLAKDTPFKDIQRTISDFHNKDVEMIEI